MIERVKIPVPEGVSKILLHSCCAPCSGEVIEALVASEVEFAIFFYNPNIHPLEEYQRRKAENVRFASKLGIPFVDADYDTDRWFERVRGLEHEPERGRRCIECFGLRLERSALFAHEHGFPLLTSSFGISRWKDLNQVNASGHKAVLRYTDVKYWDYDWRKMGGASRMVEITKREGFYRQNYCGCVFSKLDSDEKCGNGKVNR